LDSGEPVHKVDVALLGDAGAAEGDAGSVPEERCEMIFVEQVHAEVRHDPGPVVFRIGIALVAAANNERA